MENKIFIAIMAIIWCTFVCSCSNPAKTEKHLIADVQWSKDTVIIVSDTTFQTNILVTIFNEEIYNNSRNQGSWKGNILSLIKKNAKNKLDIALYATKNGNEIPIRVKVSEAIDTLFVLKLTPLKEMSATASIKGNCAPLVASFSNPDYITDVKRWLFRKNEHLSDSLLNNMVGIARELNRTGYDDFITKTTIPVLKSFAGTLYSVYSDMKADHYVLFACSSQQEINEFVEEIVSNDYELTESTLSRPFRCYRRTNSNGYKCITLIGINNDWTFEVLPLGLVAIDNIAPSYTPTNGNDFSSIIFKNNSRVIFPSNKPNIYGYANVRANNWDGNGVSCNVTFGIDFGGDVKSVTIVREIYAPDRSWCGIKPEKKMIALSGKTSPYRFTYDLHLVDGDNIVPIIVEDNHGNTSRYEINIPARFERRNSPDVNIENNIDIYN